jgi:hypothetical protein
MPQEADQSGTYDGAVNANMVEDMAGSTTVSFLRPFRKQPQLQAIVVLKQASSGLQEGAMVKTASTIKGSTNNWTGFELSVSKLSGGPILDSTKVTVTWIALADQ